VPEVNCGQPCNYIWQNSKQKIHTFYFLEFEVCALLGYYAAYSGNSLPTFLDNLSVSSSRVKKYRRKIRLGSTRLASYCVPHCIIRSARLCRNNTQTCAQIPLIFLLAVLASSEEDEIPRELFSFWRSHQLNKTNCAPSLCVYLEEPGNHHVKCPPLSDTQNTGKRTPSLLAKFTPFATCMHFLKRDKP
jgi:hypothetical protein